ncbi:MAG: hypothetical protein F4210_09505 [Holophagales bacterium]|nr:hypothetical protein [Holophagales bacterium]
MIRGLRRRHRLIWTVLFPVLAVLLAAAVLLRPDPPLVDALPEAREAGADAVETGVQGETEPSPNEDP